MKIKSITDENLEVIKRFKELSSAYDTLVTKKTTHRLSLWAPNVYFEIDLSREETNRILDKKLKELATKIEKL